uniref:Carbohydrate kinase PfkB domain-containing protein n=1 Tax=Ditylenchus dipsaci TaxID=166011 RepID=A0A915DLX2_9BILA
MLVSKDFAQSKGWNSMTEAVEGVQKDFAARSTVICAWGEKGAAGRVDSTGEMVVQEAFNPSQVIDTLAAGDCFIGACLNFLNQGFSLKEVLENGCRIAGKKCGQRGLLNLKL